MLNIFCILYLIFKLIFNFSFFFAKKKNRSFLGMDLVNPSLLSRIPIWSWLIVLVKGMFADSSLVLMPTVSLLASCPVDGLISVWHMA
jgi:hypothetical protein